MGDAQDEGDGVVGGVGWVGVGVDDDDGRLVGKRVDDGGKAGCEDMGIGD